VTAARGVAPSLAYGVFALVAIAVELALAANAETLRARALAAPALATWCSVGAGTVSTLLFGAGAALMAWAQRQPRRRRGRGRIAALGGGGVLHALGLAAAGWLLSRAGAPAPFATGVDAWVPEGQAPAFYAAVIVAAVGATVVACALVARWLLLAPATRRSAWVVFDAVLFAAIAFALWRLPSQPPATDPRALGLPVLRHVLTTLGVLRLAVRLVPFALDVTEAIGFRSLVAARHLRAEKSGFLAAIGLLSVLAVSVSCMALTSTLSVMGGFRNDLKRKILGNNAHVVIDRDHAPIADWRSLFDVTASTAGVTGASAYANGEVMLSSASNLATAVLRGIDPTRIAQVNDLPRNLKSGRLSYLTEPHKLLDLPPDALQPPWLRDSVLRRTDTDGASPDAGGPDAGVADTGRLDADVADTSDAGVEAVERRAETLKRRILRLEAFLRDRPEPEPSTEERDVLPGIIIGQELARALRLFLGDEVNVVAPLGTLGPSGPMPKSRPFRVAGVFYSGMYEYDMKVAYVALETAQRFLGMDDAISGIEVRVRDIDAAPGIAARIRRALSKDGLRVRDWQELNQRLFGALALEKLAMFITLGIAILVASFCIAGTLILMVQEKGREVAILKAMGARDRAIVGVFVIEGGLIGLLGAALGMFLGYMLCFAAEHFGIRMNPEVYYIDRLPVHVDATEFLLAGVAAVAICLVVTLYPALLASRLRPVDALRYE
jgi:lipoprotein-releasing system permease protein